MENDGVFVDIDESWFDDFWYSDTEDLPIKTEDWSIEYFLKLYNIDLSSIEPQDLAFYISLLSEEQKKDVLNDIKIKEYLKNAILLGRREYDFYEGIFKYISFVEMKDVFDKDFVQQFFSKKTGKEYIFFSEIFSLTKNKNEVISIIINNDDLFDEFKQRFDYFYSNVVGLDNNHLKQLIEKIEQTKSHEDFRFLNINKENAETIIKEEYSAEMLFWLIDKMPLEVIKDFFLNDSRAELMIPYLQQNGVIDRYIRSGIIFGDKILKNPNFFEALKCNSLIDFRNRINYIEDYCTDPFFIEEKRKKYYEEIINSYQPESGLFKIYEEILNDREFLYKDITKEPYLIDRNMYRRSNCTKENLLKETNNKLSELIIDALFQDTIYNVWINIKELLRYNSYLSEEERKISNDNLEFYKLILSIDEVPAKEKIALYNKLKEKNINLLFYEDIRKTKDLAYTKIKNKLIKPSEQTKYENKQETTKNGVPTYDLREKEFYMLVRRLGGIYNEQGARRSSGSYSLISNNNTDVFLEDSGIIYGYNSFDIEKIEHMFEEDSFTSSYEESTNKSQNSTPYPNRISTAEEIADSRFYSEILIKNKKVSDKLYEEMKPDFIVVIDEVNERSIEASKYLNIPIVIISQNKKPTIDKLPNERTDQYTNFMTYEEERKKQR